MKTADAYRARCIIFKTDLLLVIFLSDQISLLRIPEVAMTRTLPRRLPRATPTMIAASPRRSRRKVSMVVYSTQAGVWGSLQARQTSEGSFSAVRSFVRKPSKSDL